MIYILYGQPGSGKTTLSTYLCNHIRYLGGDPAVIDGDEFRKLFSNTNYTKEGRYQNIRNANAIATYISKVENRDVIMALVNPYECLRSELKANNSQVTEVLLVTSRDLRLELHVDGFEVGTPDVSLNTDKKIDVTWNRVKELLEL